LEEERYRSAAEIAEAEGVTRSFVSRLLRLTLLAPDWSRFTSTIGWTRRWWRSGKVAFFACRETRRCRALLFPLARHRPRQVLQLRSLQLPSIEDRRDNIRFIKFCRRSFWRPGQQRGDLGCWCLSPHRTPLAFCSCCLCEVTGGCAGRQRVCRPSIDPIRPAFEK
jgi:hypothetical protein